MNASTQHVLNEALWLDQAIDDACGTIAPNWPLDRSIAVNPYWGRVQRPFTAAATEMARLAGSTLWMPPGYYREAWDTGLIGRPHLARARAEVESSMTEAALLAALDAEPGRCAPLPLLCDALDQTRDLRHEPAWSDAVTHQVSQYCAAYFDNHQADWKPWAGQGLYAGWRHTVARDRGVALLMGAPHITRQAVTLPEAPRELIGYALNKLDVPDADARDLLQVALMRIGGWAAWCAYLRWQARLAGGDDSSIVDLLAIRLAWECLLDDGERGERSTWRAWRRAWADPARQGAGAVDSPLAVWHRALEIAYQQPLARALAQNTTAEQARAPSAQAVFCIDVRSEVFRRALEQACPSVQTLGFAGFFGLPIQYTPVGTGAARPQLPGLLAPTLQVTDTCGSEAGDSTLAKARRRRLGGAALWQTFQRVPASAFTVVESLGLGYAAKLVRRSLRKVSETAKPDRMGLTPTQSRSLRPRLTFQDGDATNQGAALAERVLRAMGLTEGLAPIVLLVGHGSQTANNPHAAGLDCGACCGQTGEVNARALADLLNEPAIRHALAERAIHIPKTTHFLPALHNTTTDEVTLFDRDRVPPPLDGPLDELERALAAAGDRARAARAPTLGLSHLAARPHRLAQALKARAADWAQTRPEWGLTNNAAFIVAPRARSRGIDLDGRAFLHDYDWQRDPDGEVLELIMTAPMIVTHWINMQYYASTVDNQRFGSGNKILHNVVGGRIGVFEGNNGDLRIGLPLQSVHDGRHWRHTPLRLSVFIEAPRESIDAVLAKHDLVRHLIQNQWLHLFRLDDSEVETYQDGQWHEWLSSGADESES